MAFGHLDIAYDDRVLKPRPWTTSQSRWAASILRDRPEPSSVLELCAGAAHIGLLALALADAPARPHHLVTVDLNPVACRHARRNAEEAGLAEVVEVREGAIDAVLAPDDRFDLVIADPPWVARAETGRFPEDPLIAIDGGADGMDIAWTCLRAAQDHLAPGGAMVLQLGPDGQAGRVRDRLTSVAPDLTLTETRSFGSRGVLVRLDRV
jgi:release factor glutamine methyltransferase